MSASKNVLWNHFIRTKSGNTAICNLCKKTIKCSGGSTSGLHNHLNRIHNINILKRGIVKDEDDNSETTSSNHKSNISVMNDINSRSKISDYFININTMDNSLPAILARLTARYNFSFKSIFTSYNLQELFRSKGYDIPKCPKTIKEMVLRYSVKIRQQTISELSAKLARGEMFSLTLDEWTSLKNGRFLNVIVNSFDHAFWNLGLIRIHGSMPGEKCVQYIENKLQEFSIPILCSLMKKVGRLMNVNHQICLAHGIQLVIIEVIYKNNLLENKSDEIQEMDVFDDEEDELMEYNEIFEDDEDMSTNEFSIHHEKIGPIITKIRKLVVMFRRSPTKNDILQKHVRDEFNKELTLSLDTKTRWSSLLIMLERFYKIKNCILKSLIDIKCDFEITEYDLNLVSSTIRALQPIKVAVEALCSRETNLYIADLTLKFMLDELSNQNTFLSNELMKALTSRISARRNIYSDMYYYLHEPRKLTGLENNYGVFNVTSKIFIENQIVEIIRGNHSEIKKAILATVIEPKSKIGTTIPPIHETISMKEKLNLVIQQKMNKTAVEEINDPMTSSGLLNIVRKEISYFKEQNIKGKYLEKCLKFISTIHPTSVELERAFSAAALIITKVRSRMNDETLSKMCCLRAHFKKLFVK